MRKITHITLLFLLSILIVPFFAVDAEAAGQKAMQMPPPKADIYVVPQPSDLVVNLQYPAIVKAYSRVHVVARVRGILKQKLFTEGQKVKRGDILYRIEDDIYKAKVQAAKASLSMSEAVLKSATRDWKRVQKLFKQKAVSVEKRDTSLSKYEESVAAVSLAKATLKQAQIDLGYTKVQAPISGITSMKQVDVGDLVTANPATNLLEITQNDKVFVEFSMPMSDYKKIKTKQLVTKNGAPIKVKITIDNQAFTEEGVVDFVDVNTNNQTSIVKMRAVFDNSDNMLMAGEFVRVLTQNIVQKDVITIPQKAVLQNPLGTILFVAEKGHVGVRPVAVGSVSGDKFVLRAGGALKAGDKVIVNNFFRLKPGAKVVVDKTINK